MRLDPCRPLVPAKRKTVRALPRRSAVGGPRRPRVPAPSRGFPLPYNVTVSDVLTAPPILVGSEASLFDALVLMRTFHVSGLPVVDRTGTVVGVVSEKDLARVAVGESCFPEIRGLLDVLMVGLAEQPTASLKEVQSELKDTRVADVMSSPPLVIHPDASLEFAAKVMEENAINRLPVLDERRLIGVVTRNDLVRAMVRYPPRARTA
jgi:CBS domain-containing protein